MSSSASSIHGSIPDLQSRYSGVPQRLLEEAVIAKAKLLSQKTVPDSVPRRRTTLPPGVSRNDFERAIGDLKNALGERNVEMNDKPLVDGWYMEHPYVPHFWSSSGIWSPNTGPQQYSRCISYCGSGRAHMQCRCLPFYYSRGTNGSKMGKSTQNSGIPHLHGPQRWIRWSSTPCPRLGCG